MFKTVMRYFKVLLLTLPAVHAKPCLLQVNDRQNLSATGRNFGFTCHNDR